jgi:hypothetical protein
MDETLDCAWYGLKHSSTYPNPHLWYTIRELLLAARAAQESQLRERLLLEVFGRTTGDVRFTQLRSCVFAYFRRNQPDVASEELEDMLLGSWELANDDLV